MVVIMLKIIITYLILTVSTTLAPNPTPTVKSVDINTEVSSSLKCSESANLLQAWLIYGTWVCVGDCVGGACCQIIITPEE